MQTAFVNLEARRNIQKQQQSSVVLNLRSILLCQQPEKIFTSVSVHQLENKMNNTSSSSISISSSSLNVQTIQYIVSHIDEVVDYACLSGSDRLTISAYNLLRYGNPSVIDAVISSKKLQKVASDLFYSPISRASSVNSNLSIDSSIDSNDNNLDLMCDDGDFNDGGRKARILNLVSVVINVRPSALSFGFEFIMELFEKYFDNENVFNLFMELCGENQPLGLAHKWLMDNGFAEDVALKLKNSKNEDEVINILKILKVCSKSEAFDKMFENIDEAILSSFNKFQDNLAFVDEQWELAQVLFDSKRIQFNETNLFDMAKRFLFNNFSNTRRAEVAAINILAKYAEEGKIAQGISPLFIHFMSIAPQHTFLLNAIVRFASAAFMSAEAGYQVAIDMIPSMIKTATQRKFIALSECALQIVSAAKSESVYDPQLQNIIYSINGFKNFENEVLKARMSSNGELWGY